MSRSPERSLWGEALICTRRLFNADCGSLGNTTWSWWSKSVCNPLHLYRGDHKLHSGPAIQRNLSFGGRIHSKLHIYSVVDESEGIGRRHFPRLN